MLLQKYLYELQFDGPISHRKLKPDFTVTLVEVESWGKMLNSAYKWAQTKVRTGTQAPPSEGPEGPYHPSQVETQTQANGQPQTQVSVPANLKKNDQGPTATLQQNLQTASIISQHTSLVPLADLSATVPTGPPDGAAAWVPKSGLTQENLIWPPVKRRKVSAPISPQQKTISQSPPDLPTVISVTPKVPDVPDAPTKESHLEAMKPASAEVFKCPHPTCEFATKEFSQRELLVKHMDQHKPKDPLGYTLAAVRSGLGLNKKKNEERMMDSISTDSSRDTEQLSHKASSTPLLSGVTPANMAGYQTPVLANNIKTMSSGTNIVSLKKDNIPPGGVDKLPPVNDQLPTPPSHSLWESSLTTNIRQCFSGLEQFAGLTALKTAHTVVLDVSTTDFDKLTPAYTPGESPGGDDVTPPPEGPASDAGSVGVGLLEDWDPFGEKVGFTAGMFEDVDWERESQRQMGLGGEIGSVWDVSQFELRC